MQVEALNDDELDEMRWLAEVLAPVRVFCKLLECRDIIQLPIVPFLVKQFFNKLDSITGGRGFKAIYARTLRAHLVGRIGNILTDTRQPCLICVLLAPWGGTRGLQALGLTRAQIREVHHNLMLWCNDIGEGEPSVAARIDPLLDDEDVEQRNVLDHRSPLQCAVKNVCARFHEPHERDTDAQAEEARKHVATYPVPSSERNYEYSVATIRNLSKQIGDFYFINDADADIKEARKVASVLFALGGTTAAAEQALSFTGRQDSALRSRLAPQKLEKIVVIMEHLVRDNIDIKQFATDFSSMMSMTT